ncbi:hypothetical protein INT43_004948 [Umbelopsis isabellina]|uniref:Uncharacterized protein n=1 Tax=Mortierella isabellina TaxID=91625 RepID=A0A8H7PEF6_MORIS|nr:hypothetical protein INT43_004948 [Umbelopsis isabellina]
MEFQGKDARYSSAKRISGELSNAERISGDFLEIRMPFVFQFVSKKNEKAPPNFKELRKICTSILKLVTKVIQDNNENEQGWSTDTEAWNKQSDYVDSDDDDAAFTEDSLEEQFRSEFSEVEYSGGNAAKEQHIEVAVERDEIYKKIRIIVQNTRQSLSLKKNILHPMRYGVVDLTSRHAPSNLVLQPWYEWLQNDFYQKLTYRRHVLCEREKRLILALEEDAVTDEEKSLRLLGQICDFHGEQVSDVASEHTHIINHFAHFMKIAELKGQKWRAEWGETTLNASSERRIGQRCDYLLTYKGHALYPEVLIGEVSGGLPAGANWKTWYDFLMKLVLGSRDCILRTIEKCGEQGKTSVMYSFQLSGFRLTVYAVGYFNGMWRVMMLDECFLPSSNEDKESRIEVYSILKGLMTAARTEAELIGEMLNSNAYGQEISSGSFSRKREKADDVFVIDSPKKKMGAFSP